MLWFIGLGISGFDDFGARILKVIKTADVVFLENFTSPIDKNELSKIKKLIKGKFKIAPRWMVEDGKSILSLAKKKNVVLLSYGDPYIATTHIELRTRAESEKIKTKSIHSASAITSLIGECGLQYYKIGRPVTIMKEPHSLITVHHTIYQNLIKGSHSILILEYNSDENFFLEPRNAFANLLSFEKTQKENVVDEDTFAIVASRIGLKNQSIIAGKVSSLISEDFGKPPHTIILTGRLHFTEHDALRLFTKCIDNPIDNSSRVQKISDQMLAKYIPKARKALAEITKQFKDNKNFASIIENAQSYIDDAEKFQRDSKEELAVLSIGYAEGLIDALRLSKGIDPWT